MKTLNPKGAVGAVAVAALLFNNAACGQFEDEAPSYPSQLGQSAAALEGEGRYIVKFKEHARGKSELARHGAKIERDLPSLGAVAAQLPEQALEALRHNPNVEFVEVDAKREPLSLSSQILPWGIDAVQARDPAFAAKRTDPAISVCVIDSGLQADHPDFAGMPVTGYADEGGSPWNVDKCGHGTHVAGTIAALDDSTGVVGVAPGVALHIVKVFGDNCAWAYASDLVGALQRCVDAGAKVVSMSLGGGSPTELERAAFQSAYDAGVLSIAAASNDGTSAFSYPASYPSVVSVAAVDAAEQHAWFSNYNSAVELAAPGVGVISTLGWNREGVIVHGASFEVADLLGGKPVANLPAARVSGQLVNGGSCSKASTAWTGKIVACNAAPSSKLMLAAQGKGALGVVFHNTLTGPFAVSAGFAIPAVNVSDSAGVLAAAGKTVTLSNLASASDDADWVRLDKKNGTSMATPHVSGVAALVWAQNPAWTNVQIREALTLTAKDLGDVGRDVYFGYGLVRAKAALDYLDNGTLPEPDPVEPPPTCLASGDSCTDSAQCCSGVCSGKRFKTCR